MILSSADILRILGASEIIRLTAKLAIVDSKPVLSGQEGTYIYISRFQVLMNLKLLGLFILNQTMTAI